MSDTALFTIDGQRGTKQYSVTQLASEENEKAAHEAMIEKAKAEGMVEWCFLPRKEAVNVNDFQNYVNFGLLANPFHTTQSDIE